MKCILTDYFFPCRPRSRQRAVGPQGSGVQTSQRSWWVRFLHLTVSSSIQRSECRCFSKILKIILRVCVLSLCVCSCTTCVQKRAFWNSSYRGWWAAIWVLRNKPGSPARAASALNGWAISLALPSPHPATFWNQWPWHYTGITNWRSSKLSYRSSISIYPPLPTVPFLQAHLLELWQSVKPEEEIPPSFPTTTQIWPYCKTVSSLCVHIHDQYFSPISCFFSHYRIAMSKHSRSLPLQWLPCT